MRRRLLVIASVVLLASASPALVSAQEPPEPGGCLEVLTTIDTGGAYGLGIDPVDGTVYVGVDGEGRVDIVDPETDMVVDSISLPDPTVFMSVVDHDAGILYVSSFNGGVVVVDLTDNSVITSIPVDDTQSLALNTNTNRLYAANQTTGVDVIDTTTNTIIDTLPVGGSALGVAVDPATNRIFVGDFDNAQLDIFDGATNGLVDSYAIGAEPITVLFDELAGTVWVSQRGAGLVSEIDPATGPTGVSLALPGAQGLAINPSIGQGYASPSGGSALTAFSLTDGSVIDTFPVGSDPLSVVSRVDPVRIYVAALDDGTVTVIGDVPPCPQFPPVTTTTTSTTTSTTAPAPLPVTPATVTTAVATTPQFTG